MRISEQVGGSAHSMALIENGDLDRFWPGVSGMLDKIPHTLGHMTKEEIEFGVFNGTFQLWGVGPQPNAIFILMTAISHYPSERILVVMWGAGTFRKSMIPVLDATLTSYAKIQGCGGIEIHGRRGWMRVFADIGFKEEKVILSRPVTYERMH